MANVPTVACTNCGKNFTTDDLRGTSCKFCGTLLAHHARAQQQVAVVNQMMADRNGNGIPDIYEGLAANAQANAMNQAFGMNNPYAMPAAMPQAERVCGQCGKSNNARYEFCLGCGGNLRHGPVGGGPMMMGGPMGMGNPYAVNAMNNANAQVGKAMSTIILVSVISVVGIFLLTGVIIFVAMAAH